MISRLTPPASGTDRRVRRRRRVAATTTANPEANGRRVADGGNGLTSELAEQIVVGGRVGWVALREWNAGVLGVSVDGPHIDLVRRFAIPRGGDRLIRGHADLLHHRPQRRLTHLVEGIAGSRHISVDERPRDHVRQAVIRSLLVLRVPLGGVVVMPTTDLAPRHLVRADLNGVDVIRAHPTPMQLSEECHRTLRVELGDEQLVARSLRRSQSALGVP
jgi:hypothetical protein